MSIEENARLLDKNVEERLKEEVVGPGKLSRLIDEELEKLEVPEKEKLSVRALANDLRVRRLRRSLKKSA